MFDFGAICKVKQTQTAHFTAGGQQQKQQCCCSIQYIIQQLHLLTFSPDPHSENSGNFPLP